MQRMSEWLVALERLGAVQALKTSFFAYPIVNALHIASIGALLTSVILMDLRLLGAFRDLPEQPFSRLMRRIAWIAFACAVPTGLALFSVRATDYANAGLFLVKLALILLAGVNFAAFSMLAHRAVLSAAARASAVLSILLWSSVLLAGRFLGFT